VDAKFIGKGAVGELEGKAGAAQAVAAAAMHWRASEPFATGHYLIAVVDASLAKRVGV
jgi:hypothetical protein